MAITALPTPPSRQDPTNFATRADAFLGALPTFATEANTLQTDVNAKQATASSAAATATTKAAEAAASAAAAGLSETAAGLSETAAAASAASAAAIAGAFVGTSTSSVAIGTGNRTFVTQTGEQYTSGIYMTAVSAANNGNFVFGQVVSYSGSSLVINVQATGGSGTYADWNLSLAGPRGAPGAGITPQAIGFTLNGGTTAKTLTVDEDTTTSLLQAKLVSGASIKTVNGNSLLGSGDISAGASVVRDARTSNTALAAADKGKLIDITSGTFTQTFVAAATLGSGWFCYIKNSGSGDITLDPNASETIDGLTSFVMYQGELRLVQCDGSGLNSIVLNPFYRTFTATGTFTKPPGYSLFAGLLWGGGGGGGNAQDNTTNYNFGGGGGGACAPFSIAASSVSASVTMTVGSGGSASASANVAGGTGGTSSFGSYVYAYGGGGGVGHWNNNCAGGGGGGVLSAGGAASGNNGGAGGMPSFYISSQPSHNPGFGGGYGADYNAGLQNAAYGGAGGGSPGNGGASWYGGGGGGGGRTANSANFGGGSTFGGAGGNASLTTAAGAGGVRGGGGGGTAAGTAGAGGRGEAQIWGVI